MLEQTRAENGGIVLPDAGNFFSSFEPNSHLNADKGEKTIIMSQPLHFFGPLPATADKGAEQVFDYSRMSGRYFLPDERICLIFDNNDYSELRSEQGFEDFDDLPECRDEGQEFEEGITDFDFSPD